MTEPKPKNENAVALGRLGGLSRSPKKRKGSAEMRRIRLIGWARVKAAQNSTGDTITAQERLAQFEDKSA